jgi:hypothetical protein
MKSMLKFLLLSLFVFSQAQAFIIADKNYRLSKPEDTTFKISSEGCTAAGISDAVLKSAMERTAEIWNDAPESRLKIKVGGKSGTSVNSTTIPKGEVIVGCIDLNDAGIGGTTQQDKANGSARIKMNSGVYSGTQLYGFEGVLSHEFGHAVGLTHSKDPASVMTYESNGWVNPKFLAQDDVDGVVYLYPNEDKELGGLLASCNSYSADGSTPSSGFGLDFIFGFLAIFGIWKLFRKIFKFRLP